MSRENGLLLAAVVVVALVVGGVYTLTGNNPSSRSSVSQVAQRNVVPQQQVAPAAAQVDPALCGNGVVDVGEACDPLDPRTALTCNSDCTRLPFLTPLDCIDTRHQDNCVDANNEPVANYSDCVDAQLEYCQGLTY